MSDVGDGVLRRWKTDLADFARHNLKVLTKGGRLVPMDLNAAQLAFNAACDEQMARIGRVRKVLVKARQLGFSTDIAADFMRDALLKPGTRVAVVAHRKDATSNLADMTRRFYDHLPADIKVPLVKRNDTELHFSHKSSYRLTTAGQGADTGGAGRSITATHGHFSEFAFWSHGGDHIAGLGQSVADEIGTKAIVESTALGQSNALYELHRMAMAGQGDWESEFVPWFVEPAYSRTPPAGFQLRGDQPGEGLLSERDYRERYDLSMAQMYWRRLKMAELSIGQGGHLRWQREYPASVEEAFAASEMAAFINAHHIGEARKRHVDFIQLQGAELVVGVDPASSHGPDSTAIIRRRRQKAYGLEKHPNITGEQLIAKLWGIWQNEKPAAIVIDQANVGDTVFQALHARGCPVVGVFFGGTPDDPLHFYDKRAEMYSRIMGWLPTADIPDDEDLARDLLAQRQMSKEQVQLRLVSKPDLRKEGHPSPDAADALALTMEHVDAEAGAGRMGRVTAGDVHRTAAHGGFVG